MRASALLALLVVSSAAAACSKKGDTESTKPPPPPAVKAATVTATEAMTPVVLTLTGLVTADQRSEVTADTAGKVINVMIERGQRVKFGQAVVQLDVRTAALSAREAQANLEVARAQKGLAEEECKRTQSLLDKGAITRSEFDRQETQCTSSLQSVAAAQARAEMMSKSVSDGLVRAPFDGLIAEKNVAAGEWVTPGKTLFTLVKDNPLKIELSVPEAAVVAVKLGAHVDVVAVASHGKVWPATVTRLGVEIGRTRALIVEATLDPGSDLVPGMFGEAHVVIGQQLRPVLPATAVVKRGKTTHAFVINAQGEVEDRIVQLGEPPGPGQVSIVQPEREKLDAAGNITRTPDGNAVMEPYGGVGKGEKVVAAVTEQIVDGVRVE